MYNFWILTFMLEPCQCSTSIHQLANNHCLPLFLSSHIFAPWSLCRIFHHSYQSISHSHALETTIFVPSAISIFILLILLYNISPSSIYVFQLHHLFTPPWTPSHSAVSHILLHIHSLSQYLHSCLLHCSPSDTHHLHINPMLGSSSTGYDSFPPPHIWHHAHNCLSLCLIPWHKC